MLLINTALPYFLPFSHPSSLPPPLPYCLLESYDEEVLDFLTSNGFVGRKSPIKTDQDGCLYYYPTPGDDGWVATNPTFTPTTPTPSGGSRSNGGGGGGGGGDGGHRRPPPPPPHLLPLEDDGNSDLMMSNTRRQHLLRG